MLRRNSPAAIGLFGAGSGVAASFIGGALLPGSGSFVVMLFAGILLAPVGAVSALMAFWARRRLPSVPGVVPIFIGALVGALSVSAIDWLIAVLAPQFGVHGVGGGDLILGVLTGGFAGYLASVVPAA